MNVSIEFIKGIQEKRLPIIKLTKSKNGKTGTATFLFIRPFLFNLDSHSFQDIDGIYLMWQNNKILTNDIHVIFKEGKPFLLKGTFIFKNSQEWFDFLNFMTCYSKETGLFFAETIS